MNPDIRLGPDDDLARRKMRRRLAGRSRFFMALAALSSMGVATLAWHRFHQRRMPSEPRSETRAEAGRRRVQPIPAGTTSVAESPSATQRVGKAPVFVEATQADDGHRLWASPTSGGAIDLAYLPAGVQALAVIRPKAWSAQGEGERILAALGPMGAAWRTKLIDDLGCLPEEMDSVVWACCVEGPDRLVGSYRVQLSAPWDERDMAARFPDARREEAQGQSVWIRRIDDGFDVACFLPGTSERRTLVVCPRDEANALIASAGAPLPMTGDIERIAASLDEERSISIVASRSFLDASGNALFSSSGERLSDVWGAFLGSDAKAFVVSCNWGDDFFVELRVVTRPEAPPQRYSQQVRQRLIEASVQVQELVLERSWQPYGRAVIGRLPLMLQTFAATTRAGVDQRQAVLRTYLPLTAGHNLVLATELLLHELSLSNEVDQGSPSERQSAQQQLKMSERLVRPTSLAFAKETLETSLEMLALELGAPIEIRGQDLQLEGITKNQSFGMDVRDQPLGEILVEVLRRANPDRAATGPADPRQKLVYWVEEPPDDQSGGNQEYVGPGRLGRIIVTTRSAAERRGDPLPKVFVEPIP